MSVLVPALAALWLVALWTTYLHGLAPELVVQIDCMNRRRAPSVNTAL